MGTKKRILNLQFILIFVSMFRTTTQNLSWLFTLLCIMYFPTFGMYDTQMDREYNLEGLRKAFPEIIETQPEFITLNSAGSQYNNTNGIYKLFAYYQKLSPEKQLTPADSRFIIHKHVMTGQWQLTEVYDYLWTKNIKSFPVTEENERSALLNRLNDQFIMSKKIEELNKLKQTKIEKELEAKLIDKENQNLNLFKKQNQLESKLIEKENKIYELDQ